MADLAALITAVAALVSALAWPVVLVALVYVLRGHIGIAAKDLPGFIRRMRKVKIGAFEAELDARAETLVDEAIARPGEISSRQITTTAGIAVTAQGLSDDALRRQLERLCIEFETIRKTMPSGYDRSRAMMSVLVRLRTLAPAIEKFAGELKRSGREGERLAAIAIMQVNPSLADVDWLVERFRSDPPFLFFQAAAVLRSLLRADRATADRAVAAAKTALAIVLGYPGEPDSNTVELLEAVATADGSTATFSREARESLPPGS